MTPAQCYAAARGALRDARALGRIMTPPRLRTGRAEFESARLLGVCALYTEAAELRDMARAGRS